MVGYAAGGGTDSYARTLASFIHEHLGMPFMITNKPGASGFIAAKAVAMQNLMDIGCMLWLLDLFSLKMF